MFLLTPHSKYRVACLCKDCHIDGLHLVNSVQHPDLDFCHLNSRNFFISIASKLCDQTQEMLCSAFLQSQNMLPCTFFISSHLFRLQ